MEVGPDGGARVRVRRFIDRYDILTAQSLLLALVACSTLVVLIQVPGMFRPERVTQVRLSVLALTIFAAYFAVVGRMHRRGLWVWCVASLVAITAVGTASAVPGVTMCCLIATTAVAVTAAMQLPRREVFAMSLLCTLTLGATLGGSGGWSPTLPLLVGAGGVLACAPAHVVLAYRLRLEAAAAVAQQLSVEDQLTGVLNRRGLAAAVGPLVAAAGRHDDHVAVLVVDVDHFKWVNDRFGHIAGDDVLRGVVHALSGVARAEDLLARLGGEEFCLVARLNDAGELFTVAERMRLAVAEHRMQHRVTISVGAVARRPTPGVATEDLMTDLVRDADDLMYQAKEAGRNTVRVLAL